MQDIAWESDHVLLVQSLAAFMKGSLAWKMLVRSNLKQCQACSPLLSVEVHTKYSMC